MTLSVTNSALLISIGFSIVCAVILLACYSLLYRRWNKSWTSITSASVLLIALTIIQILHLRHADQAAALFESKFYSTLIILTAPAMYLFLTEYVLLNFKPRLGTLVHLTPLVLNLVLPNKWSIPLSFLLGSLYASITLYRIYKLRGRRQRFKLEAIVALFLIITAAAIAVLAALSILITPSTFLAGYGILIGISFALVLSLILLNPDVAMNLNEAAETRYAKSTLVNVNRHAKIEELQQLMTSDKMHRDETLNLAKVSAAMSLSTHQLSELINAEYGYGFSHFIRRCRVQDAQQQLLAEPNASILSISLASGFTSQSTFYSAFNEICGETPGAFRKRSKPPKQP